jgi:hypothetical protein
MVKFPQVTVQLTGKDGNAFAIMGAVQAAMRKAGIDKTDIDTYMNDAMSGDYDNLLRVSMDTVNVL